MTQLDNIPEIKSVKFTLDTLKDNQLIKEWEVPYEELLTRLSAAIFFFTPSEGASLEEIWGRLQLNDGMHYQLNQEKTISPLDWQFTFTDNSLTPA